MFELRIARELPANYNSTNNKINQFKLRRKLARRVYRISAVYQRAGTAVRKQFVLPLTEKCRS